MDDQALRGLHPRSSQADQAKALAYFELLKESDDGWKLCGKALTQDLYPDNDHVKFFCFQVLEHFIKNGYKTSDIAQQNFLKEILLTWIQLKSQTVDGEKTFIRNKLAQLLSLVFVTDYPHAWQSFFGDLLGLVGGGLGAGAVDAYLRTLMAIDAEVVDREIVHTKEEARRNTFIKDTMREQCIPDLVTSWYQILTLYEASHPELTCLCHEVVGAYVSWIDVTLIANDRFVGVLLRHLSLELLQESAADCLLEVISKGMEPAAKIHLIESLTKVLQDAGVFPPKEDADVDFVAKLAKLVNGIGSNLIISYNKLVKAAGGSEGAQVEAALLSIENKVPLALRFLGDEDDDISLAVSDFTRDYIALLKSLPESSGGGKRRAHLDDIVFTVVRKFKYDESFDFAQQGEEEAMFLEYRKQLKLVFDNAAQLDPQLALATVHTVVTSTLRQWEQVHFTEVELGVRLLYMLGETVALGVAPPGSANNLFTGDGPRATTMTQLMTLLVASDVVSHSHWAVALQVFETYGRYHKYFVCHPEHLPGVVRSLLDGRGLHHPHPTLGSRLAYLFCRFAKDLRAQLQPYLTQILQGLADLLEIASPDNGHRLVLSNEDQLFLYEAAGVLIVASELDPQEKQVLLTSNLLAPIVEKVTSATDRLSALVRADPPDPEESAKYTRLVAHTISLASHTSKAFHGGQTMRQCGCERCYLDLLAVFLEGLEGGPLRGAPVQPAVRQYLHRMVVCLDGATLLPCLPLASQALLRGAGPKDVQEFIPLINQVISKFKKATEPFLHGMFVPLVQTIFSILASPSDQLDTQAVRDKQVLRRSYFNFLHALVANEGIQVILNQDVQITHQVLMTIIEGAVDFPDPPAQKTCFTILRKLAEMWGGAEGPAEFHQFLYTYTVPACFNAPLRPTFDFTDAQSILALSEDAVLLKTIQQKQGESLSAFLLKKFFPVFCPQLSQEAAEEFIGILEKSDTKSFKSFYKVFIGSLKM